MSEENINTYIVYLLVNTNSNNNYTYLGITNNSKRRLRQHNGILKGGAKYTNAFKGDGEWVYYLKIKNLTKSEALSIERTAKNKRKKANNSKTKHVFANSCSITILLYGFKAYFW